MRALLSFFLIFIATLSFQNCSKKSFTLAEDANTVNSLYGASFGSGLVKANPAALGQTVLIEDDGFDFSHPVFNGKIAATYSVNCINSGASVYNFDLNLSKAELLSRVSSKKNESCTLSPVVTYPKPSISLTSDEINTWNAAILKKSLSALSDSLFNRVSNFYDSFFDQGTNIASKGFGYHGTFVAGLIAYNNSETSIVTIDLNISNNSALNTLKNIPNDSCATYFSNLNKLNEMLNDADVHAAFVNQPASQVETELLNIYKKFHITLHNKSYGYTASANIVAGFIVKNDCYGGLASNGYTSSAGKTDEEKTIELSQITSQWSESAKSALQIYKNYYAAKAVIDRERYDRIYGEVLNQVTQIRAAGNDSTNLSSAGDIDFCTPYSNEITIGSVDFSGQKSDFSNYGNCVHFYMLGTRPISTLPRGVLYASDGTSFSAPLTVRMMSMLIDPKLDFAARKEQLLSFGNQMGIATDAYLLSQLSYDNKDNTLSRFAKMATRNDSEFERQALRSLQENVLENDRAMLELNSLFNK